MFERRKGMGGKQERSGRTMAAASWRAGVSCASVTPRGTQPTATDRARGRQTETDRQTRRQTDRQKLARCDVQLCDRRRQSRTATHVQH
eukprot:3753819-Rhodomonas_salina.2